MAEEELGVTLGSYIQKTKYFVDFLRCFHNKNISKIFKNSFTLCTYTCFVFHRFTELDDYRWFYKTIERVAEEELGTKYQLMAKKEEYFVDFLRYHIHILFLFLYFVFLNLLIINQFFFC